MLFIFELLAILVIILVSLLVIFSMLVEVIKRWSNCSEDEAKRKIYALINGQPISITDDGLLIQSLLEGVKNFLGDTAYDKLNEISKNYNVYNFNSQYGIRYIELAVIPIDSQKKSELEQVLVDIVKSKLEVHGFEPRVDVEWGGWNLFGLHAIRIYYAESEQEKKLLEGRINQEISKSLRQYQPVLDEDDDINE